MKIIIGFVRIEARLWEQTLNIRNDAETVISYNA